MNRGPTQVVKYTAVALLAIVALKGAVHLYISRVEMHRVKSEVEVRREPAPVIKVHVAGAVRREGVYELKTGARVEDAISAAGGFLESAKRENINLAALLEDGEKVFVPPGRTTAAAPRGDNLREGERVDINRASTLELQRVPGIGPTLAGRIVDLRSTRGPFESIEEIKLVRGIGDWRFEQLKPYISAGVE